MTKEVKFNCPSCDGKLGVESDYLPEILDAVIRCPHCEDGIRVKLVAEHVKRVGPQSRAASSTYRVERTRLGGSPVQVRADGVPLCPHCHVEVGPRDRVCLSCGGKIVPAD